MKKIDVNKFFSDAIKGGAMPVHQLSNGQHFTKLTASGLVENIERGKPIYRFFKKECDANALANGEVYVSTLKRCREYEDKLQGDSGEAIHTCVVPYASSESTDHRETLKQFGFHLQPGTNISFRNVTMNTSIVDAFVLCTTKYFDASKLGDEIGNYCVEISDPHRFFHAVGDAVSHKMLKKGEGIEFAFGPVTYKPRTFQIGEQPPGTLGFVKPPDPYEGQGEVRLVICVHPSRDLVPIVVRVPRAIRRLCRRIA